MTFPIITRTLFLITLIPSLAFSGFGEDEDLELARVFQADGSASWLSGSFSVPGQKNPTFGMLDGALRLSTPINDNFAIQFDLDGAVGLSKSDFKSYYFGGGHISWRAPHTGAVGILASYGRTNYSGRTKPALYWAGGEGQIYLDNWTLTGQAGYMSADDKEMKRVMTNALWARGVCQYYLGDRHRFEAELSHAKGRQNDKAKPLKMYAWSWAGRYDLSLFDSPFALTTSYFAARVKKETVKHLTEHIFSLGINFTWQKEEKNYWASTAGAASGRSQSMRESDRSGVSTSSPARSMGLWATTVIWNPQPTKPGPLSFPDVVLGPDGLTPVDPVCLLYDEDGFADPYLIQAPGCPCYDPCSLIGTPDIDWCIEQTGLGVGSHALVGSCN